MLNLLRSDLYRLFRSKSYYICIAVEVLLFALEFLIIYLAMNSAKELSSSMPSGIEFGLNAFTSSDATMLLGIIIAIFVTAEFTHGTMKNVVSKGFSKIQIYFSKLITMFIATYILLFVAMITGTIFATIFTGEFGNLTGAFVAHMLKVIGIEMLLYASLTALFLFVSMIIKNIGGAIAVNIVGVLIGGNVLFNLLEVIFKNKITFSKYNLLNNIAFYSGDKIIGSDYLRSVIVALVYFAVATVLGLFIFKKSDVK